MFVASRLAEGLLVGHACLAVFFVVGAAVFPWFRLEPTKWSSSGSLMRLTCICGLGAAVSGTAILALAAVGLLNIPFVIGTLAAIVGIASLCWRVSPFDLHYWRSLAAAVAESFDGPALVLYYVMLVISVPAIIPNVGGDPIHYHLAYAEDWARSGRLVVDPLLRFPFYASNVLLFQATLLKAGGIAFVNFLTWTFGLITALAIYATARYALDKRGKHASAAAISCLLSLAVIASPVYWRWLDTAYMDIPIAAFALLAAVCLYVALNTKKAHWLFPGAVLAGYLVGCKPSFLLLLPVFASALVLVARSARMSARAAMAALLLMAAVSSPWYVRNIMLTGDPMPPALNIAIHGYDGFIDKSEWAGIQEDLNTSKSPSAFASLPLRAYFDALSMDFREYGASGLILFLFLPAIYALVAFALRWPTRDGTILFTFILCALTCYWFGISSLLRYAVILLPVLAVASAFCIAPFLRTSRTARILLAALAVLAIIPSPSSINWYRERYSNFYRHVAEVYRSDDAYYRLNNEGYPEEEFASQQLRDMRVNGPVYIIGGAVEYFFRRNGFLTAGDWIGPAGWFRLYRAIDAGASVQFLDSLNVNAVLLNPDFMFGGLSGPFGRQLLSSGFCEMHVPSSRYLLYVRDRRCRADGVARK